MDTELYHVTAKDHLKDIAKEGLVAGTYFTNSEELADYYAETIEDEGGTPITLCVDGNIFKDKHIAPDFNGLYEPIMTVVRDLNDQPRSYDEDDLIEDWEASDQDWQSSLDLIGSIQYKAGIQAKDIRVLDGEDSYLLEEYLAPVKVVTKKKTPTL